MNPRQVVVPAHDARRLAELIAAAEGLPGPDREHLVTLEEKLEQAHVVRPEDVPDDVITLHSEVRIHHLDTGEHATYTLAYPGRREAANAVSVLAPMGTALLGCREGDEVDWQAPGGRRRFTVLKVLYQPEAVAGRLAVPLGSGSGSVPTRPLTRAAASPKA